MLDRYAIKILKQPLHQCARLLNSFGVTADQVTMSSFLIGLGVLPALYFKCYGCALFFLVINRIGDGVDGALARLTHTSDGGGFLDIVLDFIFYSSVVLGFALAEPIQNGLPAVVLLFSFIGTGTSFLAFAIMAERRGITSITYPHKGIYYLEGLTEATETVAFFVLFCLFPGAFPLLAYIFAFLCLVTTATRVAGGYLSLK
ncbi:CDP-alcohol phosphatidyltransferase family protein [Desulforhopalus sp. IMCC35007]|uniref:CDP-alcohol phosphatidyltransferase family protein n=1 Tax=Desulforhopalus sp. IMCC35007 TaxID=2569543 RepID=UPI0010ADF18B|nr:CDP-alcohol phosphatidyltransferase family protein [Desulforhopalus sp. IMCC35007]TKB12107.1 CDP-alcohol phosphatidyltransferase family protein [Desulforhopalus sp. IMCC35007]